MKIVKRKHINSIAAIIYLTIMSVNVYAQNNVRVDYLVNRFQQYGVENLQEKLFVHTDRDFYLAGEPLWLKVYSVDGAFHRRLSISKMCYVQILDNQGSTVAQTKVALTDGVGSSFINLPASLTSGEYTLRAYTRWMRNYGVEFFFQKKLRIANGEQIPVPATNSAQRPDIQFFAEGGSLIEGIPSKIAFKISDIYGKGIDGKGVVVAGDADSVVRFETFKFGMGSFEFTPKAGKSYKAIIQVNGQQYDADLPNISAGGYSMRVKSDKKDSLDVLVYFVGTGDPKVAFLIGHTRQIVRVALSQTFKDGVAKFTISKNQLSDGITHLTIFDASQKPICERLYFTRPERGLDIIATLAQSSFAPRQPVTVSIATRVGETPVSANLSMSVFKVDSLQPANLMNISSYLLLTSDLKGYIESPTYYFDSSNDGVHEAADNLMLTQGWRKFKWENVLSGNIHKKIFAPEYEGIIVSGRFKNSPTDMPVTNAELLLSRAGGGDDLYPSKTDHDGRFMFALKYLDETNNVVITDLNGGSLSQAEIDDPFEVERVRASARSEQAIRLSSELSDRFMHYQISPSSVGERVDQKTPRLSSFYGKPDVSYKLDDYVRFPSVEDIFREYIPEVIVRRQTRKTYLYLLNRDDNKFFLQRPLVLVDGLPVVDHEKIAIANTKSIDRIDVHARKFFHGQLVHHGIVSFHTVKGDLSGFELDSSSVAFEYTGASAPREFYTPKYSTPESRSSRLPDFRNLLTWLPNIEARQGKTEPVLFFTSDVTGKFIAHIQGITSDGQAGSHWIAFEVRDLAR